MERESSPLVSVLMGVRYRRENTFLLERAVRSILNQTYRNLECLICDDGSTQEAMALIDALSKEDKRIILVRKNRLLTLPAKLNECLRQSKGNLIARMDDDDYSYPNRIERQLDYLREHPDIAYVGCSVDLEQDGCPAGTRWLPHEPTAKDFLLVQPFIHPALIFRRGVLERANGYCEEPRCIGCEDYDLLLRLYAQGCRGANLAEPLLSYTLSPKNASGRPMSWRINEARTRYVHFKALGMLPRAWPYVFKPVIVKFMPRRLLTYLKKRYFKGMIL